MTRFSSLALGHSEEGTMREPNKTTKIHEISRDAFFMPRVWFCSPTRFTYSAAVAAVYYSGDFVEPSAADQHTQGSSSLAELLCG